MPSHVYMGLAYAGITGGLDQFSKWLVVHYFALPVGQAYFVLPFFDIRLIWNRGISYGVFSGAQPSAHWFILIASSLITLLLIWLLTQTRRAQAALGYGLIIGGAAGNIADRLLYGAVVDFISLHAAGFYWYIFNLADIWITLGVVILLWDGWQHKI